MQLCTHGYEIIKDCEVQSYFDLKKYGGYGHFAYFNTTLKIDKIYRVDVAYKVINDDKPWYQFFLPNDEHQITKSLTTKRVSEFQIIRMNYVIDGKTYDVPIKMDTIEGDTLCFIIGSRK